MFLYQWIKFIFSKISKEGISTQSRRIDPLKMEIFVAPIHCDIGGYTPAICQGVSKYFSSIVFLFSQNKMKNKGIMIFSVIL